MTYKNQRLWRVDFKRKFDDGTISRKISRYLFAEDKSEASVKFSRFAYARDYKYGGSEVNITEVSEESLDDIEVLVAFTKKGKNNEKEVLRNIP